MVFSTVLGQAMLALEPTARNSNLLPVNANGLVRLRSPECRGSCGSVRAPRSSVPPRSVRLGRPCSTWARMSDSIAPMKIEMIAGGASLAPRRWSLAAEAIDARSRSAWMSTARTTATRNTRNCRLVCVSSCGSSRLTPVSVDIDQLLCLPDPLMPGERLLVEQRGQAVPLGHPLDRLHRQHLVIAGDVALLEQRRDLVLARGHLVVPRLDRHTQPPEFPLHLVHARRAPAPGSCRSTGPRAAGPWAAVSRTGCARRTPGRAGRRTGPGR